MGVQRFRAVSAGLSGREITALTGALTRNGFELCGRAADGEAGLRLARELQPDLLIANAVMPGMDGVAFARRARGLRLDVQPVVVLLRPPGLRLPGESNLEALGTLAIDAPPTPEDLAAALAAARAWRQKLPPKQEARLSAMLDDIGMPGHPGRECLARAVALAWHDRRKAHSLKDRLYPELSALTGMTPAQIERAIRHAIEAAWQAGSIDEQHRIFGDTIDARRGKPTCSETIAQLAEELRWEGQP